jgi:glycosyltransferase involved in cell wall biosynthesis
MHEDLIRAEAEFNENVHFQPAVPYSEVLSYTCGADVGLVSVRPICLSYLYCLPNKLFECIQAGVPVLVNELPDCVSLLEHYGIGKVVRGDTPEHWLEALRQMERENPSLKAKVKEGLVRAQSELNWEKEQSSLTAIYGRLRPVHA